MLRILRAFAWLRWRVLLNSFQRTGSRDTMERLSIAADQLGPILAIVLLVPSLLVLAALSGFAGQAIASGPTAPMKLSFLRFVLLGVSAFAVAGPLVLPGMEGTNAVRLLLLPIRRAVLYVAQVAGALSDIWTLILLPVVLFLPVGLAVGGARGAAAVVLVAGLLFGLVIVGLSTLTANVAQLVVRDRRRGEIVTLAFMLVLPFLWMFTGPFGDTSSRRSGTSSVRGERTEQGANGGMGSRLFSLLPSEQYVRATRAAVSSSRVPSLGAIGALALTAAALHGAGFVTLSQLLGSPAIGNRRRRSARSRSLGRRIPGLSAGASAVAAAHLRLALRTPRGRSTLVSPVLVLLVVLMMISRTGSVVQLPVPQSGPWLAAFGVVIALLSMLALAVNQFAIDGAGLTLELLSPLSEADLLRGKAAASALLAGAPTLLCVAAAFTWSPAGSPAVWLSLVLGILATYLVVAPFSALASILFPRAVNLNSIGRGSNAHGVAGLIGSLAFAAAAAVPAGLAALAILWLHRPWLAPVAVAMWCIVALVGCRAAFVPLRRLLRQRRENLGLVVR